MAVSTCVGCDKKTYLTRYYDDHGVYMCEYCLKCNPFQLHRFRHLKKPEAIEKSGPSTPESPQNEAPLKKAKDTANHLETQCSRCECDIVGVIWCRDGKRFCRDCFYAPEPAEKDEDSDSDEAPLGKAAENTVSVQPPVHEDSSPPPPVCDYSPRLSLAFAVFAILVLTTVDGLQRWKMVETQLAISFHPGNLTWRGHWHQESSYPFYDVVQLGEDLYVCVLFDHCAANMRPSSSHDAWIALGSLAPPFAQPPRDTLHRLFWDKLYADAQRDATQKWTFAERYFYHRHYETLFWPPHVVQI